MWDNAGGRRAPSGRLIFPEYRNDASQHGSPSRRRGHRQSETSLRSHRRSEASRHSYAQVLSIMEFVQAGDSSSLEQFLSAMSPSERELAFAAETVMGGSRSPVLAAVKHGHLGIVRTVLKWLPEEQAGTLLSAKDDEEGQTILMLAASTGNVDIFESLVSQLPRDQMLKLLKERCVRGNLVIAYAAKTGKATMVEAVLAQFPPDGAMHAEDALCVQNFNGETPLLQAAGAPEPGAFQVIAKTLPASELDAQLDLITEQAQTALTIATRAGHPATWRAVASKMLPATVNRQLTSVDLYGETAVLLSIRSGSVSVFRLVVGCLTEEQILIYLGARNKQGQTPAQVAVASGAESVLVAMMRPEWISACALDAPDESEAQLTALDLAARPPANLAMVKCLLACGATPTSRVLQRLIRNCDDGGRAVLGGGGGWVAVRECLLGAIANSEWTINPLIPGLNLYVAIIAARRQSSFSKTKLARLKSEVDALVLCILRHLPDTVEGFDHFFSPGSADEGGGAATATTRSSAAAKPSLSSTIARGVSVTGGRGGSTATAPRNAPTTKGMGIILVQEMLEPELAGLQPRHCAGPLAQALQSRHVDFICTPIVHDYLRLKFSAGLPNPFRETKWRRENARMDRDLARFMVDEDESKLVVYILQGGCADSPSWTYLPGLQFILAGVCGKTEAFFGVPALRLALDVLVYFGVVVVFVLKVVVLRDAHTITPWEWLWVVYLVGAMWKQWRDVQEAGSIRVHLFNPWNVVEVMSLASLLTALVFRGWAYVCAGEGQFFCGELSTGSSSVSELNEIYLAQYFQAASAPFVLGRILFLTQIHSSLGPLLHSTFNMMRDLTRFGALMLVITFGFALAFYAMFGSTSASQPDGGDIPAFSTYYTSLLTLFASMLGNFDFKVFDDAPMAEAGVVLLAFFLCVMNITLLNLLIAILATAHAKVEVNADKEAVLSEAVIITQYRRAMRLDSLPSPLNVPQELISHLCWRHKERAKEVFARAVFWLVSGPIAIFATAVLWALSAPLTLAWAGRVLRSSGSTMLVPALLGLCFNLGLAPLATAWLWLGGISGIWQQGHGTMEISDRNEIEASRAHRRRGTYAGSPVGSPIATVASAALANLASTGESALDGAYNRGRSPSRNIAPASKLWQLAARAGGKAGSNPSGGGGGRGGGSVGFQGFNVVTAIGELHGVTVEQLKQRLDDRIAMMEEDPENLMPGFFAKTKRKHAQHDRGFAEALSRLKRGHDRLEEMVRKADESRVRMETKLDQVFQALGSKSNSSGGAGNGATMPCENPEKQTAPPPFVAVRGSSRRETTFAVHSQENRRSIGERKGANSVVGGGGGQTLRKNDDGSGEGVPREDGSGPDLDKFIDEYHAEVTSR